MDTSLLAEAFNNYFASVGSSIALAAEKITNDHNLQLISPLSHTIAHPSNEQFRFDNISMGEVQCTVSEMPLNKLPGVDYISHHLTSTNLYHQHFFNVCHFPNAMENVNVDTTIKGR